MKKLSMMSIRLLAICLLLAPLGVQAQGLPYSTAGKLYSLSNKHINVDDTELRLSPTVKVVLPGNKPGTLAALKKGDFVGVKVTEYRGRSYVDTIFYLPGGDLPNELPPPQQ